MFYSKIENGIWTKPKLLQNFQLNNDPSHYNNTPKILNFKTFEDLFNLKKPFVQLLAYIQ